LQSFGLSSSLKLPLPFCKDNPHPACPCNKERKKCQFDFKAVLAKCLTFTFAKNLKYGRTRKTAN
jgi:hypothetical protein